MEKCKLNVFTLLEIRQLRFSPAQQCSTISFNSLSEATKKSTPYRFFVIDFEYYQDQYLDALCSFARYWYERHYGDAKTSASESFWDEKKVVFCVQSVRLRTMRVETKHCVFAQFTVLVLIASCYGAKDWNCGLVANSTSTV